MCIDQWYTFLNYFIILLVLVVNILLFLCRAHVSYYHTQHAGTCSHHCISVVAMDGISRIFVR